jgi:hypothetical protein
MPKGSGEPETPSVGPDWTATTFITVLDGLRLMSFNPYPTGTLILIPDKIIRGLFGKALEQFPC